MTHSTVLRRALYAGIASLLCALPGHAAGSAGAVGDIWMTRLEAVTFGALIFVSGFLVGGLIVCPPKRKEEGSDVEL